MRLRKSNDGLSGVYIALFSKENDEKNCYFQKLQYFD